MADDARRLNYPDGIDDRHAEEDRGFQRHASPLSILILGALLVVALLGFLGGAKSPSAVLETPSARLSVTTPEVLRNGIFFETRIAIDTRADFKDLTLAIPQSLWKDMTINSMVPAADKEAFEDGAFHFHYGPLPAGTRLDVKIDGQINPPLFAGTSGFVALYEGDTRVALLPISLKVLP